MKTLIFHMGAHRCGSTAVQSVLRRERTALAEMGVGVSLRSDMLGGDFDLRRLHRYHSFNPLWRQKLNRTAQQLCAMPFDTLVMSEENLMGTMPMVRGAEFYPHFHRLVQGLGRLHAKLAGKVQIAPRLVVRRQDRYLESVYAFRVSRGFQDGFDRFVKEAGDIRRGWLQLAEQLSALPDGVDTRIAMLEAWPKGNGSASALEFLIGAHDLPMSVRRLTGNTRWPTPALRVALAMNRAGIRWKDEDWSPALFETMAGDDIGSDEQVLDLLKPHVRISSLKRFKGHFAAPVKLGFDEDERKDFLKAQEKDNKAFCALPVVQGDYDLWAV